MIGSVRPSLFILGKSIGDSLHNSLDDSLHDSLDDSLDDSINDRSYTTAGCIAIAPSAMSTIPYNHTLGFAVGIDLLAPSQMAALFSVEGGGTHPTCTFLQGQR